MNNITIRNIPDSIHKKLKRRARLFRRSLNNEILACLEQATMPNKINTDLILKKAEEIHRKLKFDISLDEINLAKQVGRK